MFAPIFATASIPRTAARRPSRTCSASPTVLEIIRHSAAWYDGSRSEGQLSGDKIPVGSRLIAIMDAFETMAAGNDRVIGVHGGEKVGDLKPQDTTRRDVGSMMLGSDSHGEAAA